MLVESIAAAVLLTGGNYADYSTTQQALRRGGIEVGPQHQAPLKVALVAAETGIFMMLHKEHKKTSWAFVAAVVGVNLIIARHNSQVMR